MYAELDTEQWREGMHQLYYCIVRNLPLTPALSHTGLQVLSHVNQIQLYYCIVRNLPLTPALAHRASSPFSRESDSAHQNHAANDSVLQRAPLGTQFPQFTCFTGTKVQILTLRVRRPTCKSGPLVAPIRSVISSSRKRLNRPPRKKVAGEAGARFTCFTGTRVQILTQLLRLREGSRCSVYLLYWYTSTNTDAAVAVARGKQEFGLRHTSRNTGPVGLRPARQFRGGCEHPQPRCHV
jgi:hypothetical protein